MSDYDPNDEEHSYAEHGMLNEQDADDFANFDPKRYLNRRRGTSSIDDRDELELGVRPYRRPLDSDTRDGGKTPAAPDYRGRMQRQYRTSIERNAARPRHENFIQIWLNEQHPFTRWLVYGLGCMLVFAVVGFCIAMCWLAIVIAAPR